ncbi:MAG: hypothetical protein EZS28_024952 [Streblomastix strix]|uniref:Uncharacterized protein n=1 Tax=Streblomastix strix TaxID=222440 RepID=A0A5J4VAP5_9EUKA|nr:MAG: hypothetical protein EZS28_024952 [Streblomastix strix]
MIWYKGIRRAIVTGNVLLFRNEIQRHQEFFIRIGVYLLILQLEMLAFRQLFKRIHQEFVQNVPDYKYQISFVQLLNILMQIGLTDIYQQFNSRSKSDSFFFIFFFF